MLGIHFNTKEQLTTFMDDLEVKIKALQVRDAQALEDWYTHAKANAKNLIRIAYTREYLRTNESTIQIHGVKQRSFHKWEFIEVAELRETTIEHTASMTLWETIKNLFGLFTPKTYHKFYNYYYIPSFEDFSKRLEDEMEKTSTMELVRVADLISMRHRHQARGFGLPYYDSGYMTREIPVKSDKTSVAHEKIGIADYVLPRMPESNWQLSDGLKLIDNLRTSIDNYPDGVGFMINEKDAKIVNYINQQEI